MIFVRIVLFLTLISIAVCEHDTQAMDSLDNPLQIYANWVKTPEGKSLLPFVRETIASLLNRQKIEIPDENRFPWLTQPVGVFLTAMKGRKVRVCVGVFTPTESTLAQEIIRQCKRLVIEDPRHAPLSPNELDGLRLVISFVDHPIPIEDPSSLDIWNRGLLMRWNGREAVLLPGEAKTVSWGIGELRRQILIPQAEIPSYASFSVVLLQESKPPKIGVNNPQDKPVYP